MERTAESRHTRGMADHAPNHGGGGGGGGPVRGRLGAIVAFFLLGVLEPGFCHPDPWHRGLPQSRCADASLRADLVARLAAAGDPDRAEGQQRYMKSELPFHGVRVPEVRRLTRAVIRDHPLADPGAWEETVLGIWRAATHREQRYGAIELAHAQPYRAWLRPDRLAMVEEMVVTGAWWDYVDQLAGKHMGHLLATYPEDVRPVLLSWAEDDDIWRRRAAILAQLRFKDRTDPGLLFAVIEPSIARKEFFLRKAIGWALREYSKTRPDAVTRYVEANRRRLSPLSRREAMKALASRRRTSKSSPSHQNGSKSTVRPS